MQRSVGKHDAQVRIPRRYHIRHLCSVAHDIGAGVVIPCHYEMFEFNTASPALFEATCRDLGQPYATLRAGEHRRFEKASHP